jgi:hypothetical protein
VSSTLKASKTLASDFVASINTAKPMRLKLQSWYSNLPEAFRIASHVSSQKETQRSPPQHGIAILQFCYLTAQVLLHRALLRTIARSPPLAIITSSDEDEAEQDYFPLIDQMSWQDLFTASQDFGQLPSASTVDSGAALEATLDVAEKCGAVITQFVRGLAHEDFDAFWYGCKSPAPSISKTPRSSEADFRINRDPSLHCGRVELHCSTASPSTKCRTGYQGQKSLQVMDGKLATPAQEQCCNLYSRSCQAWVMVIRRTGHHLQYPIPHL